MNRNVKQLVTAHRQREGAGFVVRRPVPTVGLELVDPFLLIDELGPVTYGLGEAIGAPDHPHRGFETVSYILEGAVDWTLEPGADVTIDIGREQQVLAYVFDGAIAIEDREVRDGQMAILGDGDAIRLRSAGGRGRLLLLAGVPHGEPVARYGPFVMTSERELIEAFHDYQSGRMGDITRTARVG